MDSLGLIGSKSKSYCAWPIGEQEGSYLRSLLKVTAPDRQHLMGIFCFLLSSAFLPSKSLCFFNCSLSYTHLFLPHWLFHFLSLYGLFGSPFHNLSHSPLLPSVTFLLLLSVACCDKSSTYLPCCLAFTPLPVFFLIPPHLSVYSLFQR